MEAMMMNLMNMQRQKKGLEPMPFPGMGNGFGNAQTLNQPQLSNQYANLDNPFDVDGVSKMGFNQAFYNSLVRTKLGMKGSNPYQGRYGAREDKFNQKYFNLDIDDTEDLEPIGDID